MGSVYFLHRFLDFKSFRLTSMHYSNSFDQNVYISINIIHSIFLAKGFHIKNQPPLVPVANSNRAEIKKVDIPVSGEDSVDSKKTGDGTSIKINPYRKVKGMGSHVI